MHGRVAELDVGETVVREHDAPRQRVRAAVAAAVQQASHAPDQRAEGAFGGRDQLRRHECSPRRSATLWSSPICRQFTIRAVPPYDRNVNGTAVNGAQTIVISIFFFLRKRRPPISPPFPNPPLSR